MSEPEQPALLLGVASAALDLVDPIEICQLASRERLDGVEWGVGEGQVLPFHAPASVVANAAQAASRFGLRCCGVSVHDDGALLRPPADWDWLAETAVAVNAPHLRVYAPPPAVIEQHGSFQSALRNLQDRIAEYADRLSGHGLKLLIEPSPRTLIPGPGLAREALATAEQDRVGVVYDPGSLAQEGWLDPFLAVSILGQSLRHVHVKNVVPRLQDGRWSWTYERLRTGYVDWERALAVVRATGYRGWYVLDHLSSAQPGVVTTDLNDLRQLLAPLG